MLVQLQRANPSTPNAPQLAHTVSSRYCSDLSLFVCSVICLIMASNIPLPAQMDVSDRDTISKNWKMFRREWEDYEIASELGAKEERIRVATLRIVLGRECVAILDNLDLTPAQAKKVGGILDALQSNFEPQCNIIYERSLFYSSSQLPSESITQYVNKLRRLASSCDFTPARVHEENIRDRLVLGVRDKTLKKQLLSDATLTLARAIAKCKAAEQSDVEMAALQEEPTEVINYTKNYAKDAKKVTTGPPAVLKECRFCGGNHKWDKNKCPAFGKTCRNCGKANHFAQVCGAAFKKVKKVNALKESDDDSSEEAF